jgi:hypothetical protein
MSLSPIGLSMIHSVVDLLERTDSERQEMTMNSEPEAGNDYPETWKHV